MSRGRERDREKEREREAEREAERDRVNAGTPLCQNIESSASLSGAGPETHRTWWIQRERVHARLWRRRSNLLLLLNWPQARRQSKVRRDLHAAAPRAMTAAGWMPASVTGRQILTMCDQKLDRRLGTYVAGCLAPPSVQQGSRFAQNMNHRQKIPRRSATQT